SQEMASVGVHRRAVIHDRVRGKAELRDEVYEPGPSPAEEAGSRGLRGRVPWMRVSGQEHRRREEEQERKDETGGARARQTGHTNPFRERRLSPAPARDGAAAPGIQCTQTAIFPRKLRKSARYETVPSPQRRARRQPRREAVVFGPRLQLV